MKSSLKICFWLIGVGSVFLNAEPIEKCKSCHGSDLLTSPMGQKLFRITDKNETVLINKIMKYKNLDLTSAKPLEKIMSLQVADLNSSVIEKIVKDIVILRESKNVN